eukprot:XP_015576528.1 uncharacterized protein LOC8258687 [Ricinus communis]
MALAISNILNCPKPQLALRNSNLKRSLSVLPPPFVRFLRTSPENKKLVCAAASAAGSSSPDSDLNPYEVLGVSSIEGFDVVKAKYTKKRKEAEMIGDEATTARLEKAYDKLMMSQLTSRKKGMAYGSFKVSKDIKYADKQPIVPWGPRFAKSSVQDMRINLAISAAFVSIPTLSPSCVFAVCNITGILWRTWCFLHPSRLYTFSKKMATKISISYMVVLPIIVIYTGPRPRDQFYSIADNHPHPALRSLALVFGCIAFASLAYTGILNLIEFIGSYIPVFLFNNQELIVTTSSAVILYILGSYYR